MKMGSPWKSVLVIGTACQEPEPEGDSSSIIETLDSEPWGLLSVASGYGVNGSGIVGHRTWWFSVCGNGEEEGSPREARQTGKEVEGRSGVLGYSPMSTMGCINPPC